MSDGLNLAKQPFLNPRPVLRVAILFWVLGVAVAVFNVRLYFTHFSGSSETRERQETLQSGLDSERAEVRRLSDELAGYDVERQNEQAVFLNAKIAERSFSWSELFDRLGEVMPAQVRVTSVSPQFERAGSRYRSGPRENEVLLGLRGVSRSPEVLLEFVDSLFAHPSFRDPNLSSESLQDAGLLDFQLSVIYEARPPEVEVVAEEASLPNEPSTAQAESHDTADTADTAEAAEAAEATEDDSDAPAEQPEEGRANDGR